MSKIHHCEFCGTIGASKVKVIGTEYTGEFYLCEHCSERVGKYSIKGKTRGEFINEVYSISELFMHGPKSGAFSRERSNWGLMCICDNCSRKITSGGLNFGDELIITPLIKKSLPSRVRAEEQVHLCPNCTDDLQREMVSQIPIKELPLAINTTEFQGTDGEPWEFLNDELRALISKKLQGVPLEEIPSLGSAKEKRCLDISLFYLTEEDRKLFEKDTIKDSANPLIIAPYEHGYLIELDIEFEMGEEEFLSDIKKFKYSNKLLQIIERAVEMEYDYIRFDTVGPKYQEFETSKKV